MAWQGSLSQLGESGVSQEKLEQENRGKGVARCIQVLPGLASRLKGW